MKQYQLAIEQINKALKINENIARAYYLKGSIYRESGDTTRAVSSLETAIEQDNAFSDAFYDLGIIYAARVNPLALDYLNNAIRTRPNYFDAYYAKAKFYQDLGKFDEALKEYENLLNKDKTYSQAYYNSGAIYLDIKQEYDLAIELFNKALELNNQWPAAYFARGYCFAKKGMKEEAKENYQKCLSLDQDYTAAKIGLRELK